LSWLCARRFLRVSRRTNGHQAKENAADRTLTGAHMDASSTGRVIVCGESHSPV
jgi:hypothetical protein